MWMMVPLATGLLVFGGVACDSAQDTAAPVVDTGGDPAAGLTGDDQDGDSILDLHEGEDDADGDGTPNYLDLDSDGDGVGDAFEAGDDVLATLPVDTDQDGLPSFLDLDSDGNCLTDVYEARLTGQVPADSDGDGAYDAGDFDDDGDTILDIYEITDDCGDRDSDGDGTHDRLDIDSDGDGIGDLYEAGTTEFSTEPADTDGDGVPDYLDHDSDGDGISDTDEGGVTDPTQEPRDTDGDGLYDSADVDADGDGLRDDEELAVYGTDPYDADTDGDGFTDGTEDVAGTNPLDAESFPDGIYVVLGERSWVEEEFEFDVRIEQADIAFLLDSTCSMTGTMNALAGEFSGIVTDLASLFPDAEYGFATFDDFAYAGYGERGVDKPFILRKQITSNLSAMQSELSGVPTHNGVDGIASTLEAVYQAAAGAGYDQNCDTVYQDVTDILPFLADSDDPFGGLGGQAYSESTPGGGDIGGMGFRDLSLPIIVYASDTTMRNRADGYGVPGGCPGEATADDVVSAAQDIGAQLLGICVGGVVCRPQMEALAEATDSYADLDGGGEPDDLLVVDWTGSDDEFRETVTGALEDLVGSIRFDTVELVFEGDEWGFVASVEPALYENVDELADGDTVLTFIVGFVGVVPALTEDQTFAMTMNVIGDESVLLDTQDITILVPGAAY